MEQNGLCIRPPLALFLWTRHSGEQESGQSKENPGKDLGGFGPRLTSSRIPFIIILLIIWDCIIMCLDWTHLPVFPYSAPLLCDFPHKKYKTFYDRPIDPGQITSGQSPQVRSNFLAYIFTSDQELRKALLWPKQVSTSSAHSPHIRQFCGKVRHGPSSPMKGECKVTNVDIWYICLLTMWLPKNEGLLFICLNHI